MTARDDILANYFLKAAGIAAVVVDARGVIRANEFASIKLGRGEIAFCCRRGEEPELLAGWKALPVRKHKSLPTFARQLDGFGSS